IFATSLLALTALTSPTALGQSSDLEAFVRGQVERASDAPASELWTRALGLRDAAEALGAGDLDATLDRRLEQASDLDGRGLLLLAAARLQADGIETDVLRGMQTRLLEIARGDSDAEAAAALDLLGRRAFRTQLSNDREELASELLAIADDGDRSPTVRIDASLAAHAIGGGRERRQGRSNLLAFLDSSDAESRSLAALGLASIGDEIAGKLELELDRLTQLPGSEAALAEAYLKLERSKRLRDRRIDDLRDQLASESLPPELDRINAAMEMVLQRHLDGELYDRDDLAEAAMAGMLRALDEHSAYMSPEVYGRFMQDLEAEYGGIGAYVGIDPSDNLFTITRPIYSGPAYTAGLQTDDKIVRVDDWPTLGEPQDEVIKRLKGEPGTGVKLYIWRRGMDAALIDRPTEDMAVMIERGQIEIPAVHSQMLPGGIGLIELSTFSRVASSELQAAIEVLLADGMEGLILDLRRNGGGLLTEAVNVADLFLPRGEPVVTADYRGEPPQTLFTRRPALLDEDFPLVVLTSRFSASASEIVAGALQDLERATLVGERSFGKGSVQNLETLTGTFDDRFIDENGNQRFDDWEPLVGDFDEDGEYDFAPRLKLTIARYLLPSGRSIHREIDRDGNLLSEGGIRPDVEADLGRIANWRIEEQLRLRSDNVARDYVDRYWEENRELFTELATTDLREPERYPGFDELYASLNTTLPANDVRRLLRLEVRRRVQDERGGEFPIGDFQEDDQVQAGMNVILDALGRDAADYPAIAAALQPDVEVAPEVAATDPLRGDLRSALARIRGVREEGSEVGGDELDALLAALAALGYE
ncbi:MAG: S41 family peptidase, partial [Planctomycetota bacterium]